MKLKTAILLLVLFLSSVPLLRAQEVSGEEEKIAKVIDQMHKYASKADFTSYFSLFTDDFEFIGTESSEVWDLEAFKKFTRPYFEKGKGWTYIPRKRSIQLNEEGSFAWFHEVLDSAYGLCRGSGVVEKVNGEWKLQQYVLSVSIPNSVAKQVVELKKEAELRERALLPKQTK